MTSVCNDVETWMHDNLEEDDYKYLRKLARERIASGMEATQWQEVREYKEKEAAKKRVEAEKCKAKKEAHIEKLQNTKIIENIADASSLKVTKIDAQLDSLRQHDLLIPTKAELTQNHTKKQDKVNLLVEAIARRSQKLEVE